MQQIHDSVAVPKRLRPKTLRARLSILLVISVLIPVVMIGFISFQWMSVVQTTKIDEDLTSSVKLGRESIERILNNLSDASQMLTFDSGTGQDVVEFLQAKTSYERAVLFKSINKSVNLINLSNPSLGQIFYYFPGQETAYRFENLPITENLNLKSLPIFYQANRISYYGPHPSVVKGAEDRLVFSIMREAGDDLPNTYVYVETRADNFKDILSPNQLGMKALYFLVNPDGKIAYSDDIKLAPLGKQVSDMNGLDEKFKSYASANRNGWTLVMAVSKLEYAAETNKWLRQYTYISALSLSLGLLFATVIWRMVNRPLQLITKEVRSFTGQEPILSSSIQTGLNEFDILLERFYDMRNRLIELIGEIKQEEKRRGEMEVEKLLVQINPHFLHNTLNTVQWLARIHHQPQIDRLVSIFTRVLHYNLGKQNIIVRLEQEVEALSNYIELQNIRYNYVFQVKVDVDPDLMDIAIPRFILQPLVENALYHGLPDDKGEISVSIRSKNRHQLEMRVSDNGTGMDQDQLQHLFSNHEFEKQKSGLGIGLKYVIKLLEVYYKEQAKFDIKSAQGKGTVVSLILPLKIEGVSLDDKSNDR
ncbi:sensor histidine kinase [Paenibacillus dokdonensis]|uniref:sensor histidine kinase n=1 Tax=Paenibacillus dokdonensis TaxID=2567944 RepID=UPI0010A774BD|nr:histidine kinase [Paenibacillus dokdonensis]